MTPASPVPPRHEGSHLGAYACAALGRAEALARRFHAEELTTEHVLVALFGDEDCGATRLVLHAFADPETLVAELVALSPGILVVGSGRSLPFSVRGVRALEGARASAALRGSTGVEPSDLFHAAAWELEAEHRTRLEELGAVLEPAHEALLAGDPVPARGPLLKHFTQATRRSLGTACRVAARLGRDAISPVHVLGGLLEAHEPLAQAANLTSSRLRMALAERDLDLSPIPERELPLASELRRLLDALPPGADSLALLGEVLARGREEVRALLARQKVTRALYGHARDSFGDPE